VAEETEEKKEVEEKEVSKPENKKGGMGKKIIFGIVGIIVLFVIIGVFGGGEKKTQEEGSIQQQPTKVEEKATEQEATTEEVEAEKEVEPFKLSGVGQQATEKFTLKKGLAIFKMIHSGSSNFIVHLLDEEGNQVGFSLVNEIGPFDGSKAVSIPRDGVYLLDIDADGSWTVAIE